MRLSSIALASFLLFAAATSASAQGIGDRLNKVGDRVVSKTDQRINSKINQRVSKVNSGIDRRIDRTVDKALDPKTYKQKRKAKKKQLKQTQSKEEKKAIKQQLKADKKEYRQRRKDNRQKWRAVRKAEKAGYFYTPPTQETDEEKATRQAQVQESKLARLPKNSYYNSFNGSFKITAQYYMPQSEPNQPLKAIPDKKYDLTFFGRPSMTTIHTQSSLGEFSYTTAYEEDINVYEDSIGRVVSDTNKYCRFVFVDYKKHEFIAKNLLDIGKTPDSLEFQKELVATKYFIINGDSIHTTRYWGENDRYKVELWADDSRRVNTIHAFNTIFGISNERPDLMPTLPINLIRVPVIYATIYHKFSQETLILNLTQISNTPPDPANFATPSEDNFTKLEDKFFVPRFKNPNNPPSDPSNQPLIKDVDDIKKID